MFDPVEAIEAFVRQPSVSTDPSYHKGMDGARQYISNLLADIGFAVEIVETPLHPVILAKRSGEPTWPHVIIYGHYDVQPADPFELWTTPPFEPEVRDGHIFGRGVADNKGPLLVHVSAVARLLEKHPDLPLRITFLIEGEEEIGSPSFAGFLDNHKDFINADFVLLSDTQSPDPDQIVITTGLRGIVCLNIELTGARKDLHSGIHGGALLNPIQAQAELCASLHTPDGRVNIPGFYDDVVDVEDWEREELARLGGDEKAYAEFLGIETFYTADGFSPFEATRFGPTLEFNGIGGGYQGEGSKTVIPSRAFAKISCRLVADQDPQKIQQLLIETLQERCPPQVSLKIDRGHCGAPYLVVPPGKPNVSPQQSPHLAKAFTAAESAISEIYGKPPLYLREGGSVPIIADLQRVIGIDSLMIGMCTPDSNLHAPDENLHLGMFHKGIDVSERILAGVAGI